jgi:hypothetical protein
VSKLTTRLVVGILTFAVGVAATGWYFWQRKPARVSITTVGAPDGWERVDIKGLYLLLPSDLKQREAHGIDTEDFEFGNDSTTVNIEYGINQGDFSDLTDHPDYHEEAVIIDGQAAKLRFCHNDSSKTDYGDAAHPYITAIYLQTPLDNPYGINLWAKSRDAVGQELAKRIFLSARFKKFKN